jgi:hypothetical protein
MVRQPHSDFARYGRLDFGVTRSLNVSLTLSCPAKAHWIGEDRQASEHFTFSQRLSCFSSVPLCHVTWRFRGVNEGDDKE